MSKIVSFSGGIIMVLHFGVAEYVEVKTSAPNNVELALGAVMAATGDSGDTTFFDYTADERIPGSGYVRLLKPGYSQSD